ncbi:hypothetical protein LCGC14_1235010 [marine sediment metagenome]|uniref:Uncharacterized protein n=1 Tax=marine sediment metagenome TaxID=412755 RepID=A0A0F9LBN9_9ZZZZ
MPNPKMAALKKTHPINRYRKLSVLRYQLAWENLVLNRKPVLVKPSAWQDKLQVKLLTLVVN